MLRFLLHTCCAPCSVAVINELKGQYDLSVFFYNPNIYPREEYDKRKKEVIKICNEWQVPMIDLDYEVDSWENAVKSLESEKEGGERCRICFRLRLEKAAEYAQENGFKIFGTSLTMGSNKSAEIINPFGEKIAARRGLQFFAADWKIGGRREKARKMIEERDIYRQNYCGCRFSLP